MTEITTREAAQLLGRSASQVARTAAKHGLGEMRPLPGGTHARTYYFTAEEVERMRHLFYEPKGWVAVFDRILAAQGAPIIVPANREEWKVRNGLYQVAHRRGHDISLHYDRNTDHFEVRLAR